jgi:hypothetical protein
MEPSSPDAVITTARHAEERAIHSRLMDAFGVVICTEDHLPSIAQNAIGANQKII